MRNNKRNARKMIIDVCHLMRSREKKPVIDIAEQKQMWSETEKCERKTRIGISHEQIFAALIKIKHESKCDSFAYTQSKQKRRVIAAAVQYLTLYLSMFSYFHLTSFVLAFSVDKNGIFDYFFFFFFFHLPSHRWVDCDTFWHGIWYEYAPYVSQWTPSIVVTQVRVSERI